MTLLLRLLLPLGLVGLGAFTFPGAQSPPKIRLVDPQATAETQALFTNLQALAGKYILFGQQDALAYGVEWKDYHKKRSDVKDVCGMHPALVGWELSKLGSSPVNIDTVNFESMKGWIKQVYKMGGVNEISWHMDNFVTGGNSWEVGQKVVGTILPGGIHHEAYLAKLDAFADFVADLQVGFLFKTDIPLIFRPFHEHTGSWFWWGNDHCTPEEYKAIWRFTVEYLRDQKGLHNLLYCYSPDVFRDEAHYLERYPGDEYVDVLGMDDYHDLGPKGQTAELLRRVRTVVELAEQRGKISAISETGSDGIPDPTWWTEKLLNPIKNDPVASRISWVMVWRNARPTHHYAPYPGHSSVPDFLQFSQDPRVLFAPQLPNLYRLN